MTSALWRSFGLSLFIWSLLPSCLNSSWWARLVKLRPLLHTTCLPLDPTVLSTSWTGPTATILKDSLTLLLWWLVVFKLSSTVTSSTSTSQKSWKERSSAYRHNHCVKISQEHRSQLCMKNIIMKNKLLIHWKNTFLSDFYYILL